MSEHHVFPAFGEEKISVKDAYFAAFNFLTAYWERGGQPNDSVWRLLSWMQPVGSSGHPVDPAMWHDWIEAMKQEAR
jgi:hypothetical protein